MPLKADQMVLEGVHTKHQRAGFVRDKIDPIFAARGLDRCRDDFEINRAVSIG